MFANVVEDEKEKNVKSLPGGSSWSTGANPGKDDALPDERWEMVRRGGMSSMGRGLLGGAALGLELV